MHILMAHNRYALRGGEDVSTEADIALLREHGHRVTTFEVSNDAIEAMGRCRAALRASWSVESYRAMQRKLRDARPDVVHVQNFFPLLSPSIHHAAAGLGVPVVQTLHNYRLLCLNALLLRDGKVCELCKTRRLAWPGIRYRCYRGSRAGSAAVAAMLAIHRGLGTWRRCVTRFIALTEFSRRLFIEGGLPGERFAVRPNFVNGDPGLGQGEKRGVLFAGALLPWKGAGVLLEAWRRCQASDGLLIAGAGPEEEGLRRIAAGQPRVRFAGALDGVGVAAAMRQARFLVVPSISYEGLPRVIPEAFACATPVIASRLGAMAELVRDGETGLLFHPGDADDLAAKLQWALAHPESMRDMGLAARREYEAKYTADAAYKRLMEIYHEAARVIEEGFRGQVSGVST